MRNKILRLISLPFIGDEIRVLTNQNGKLGMVRLFTDVPSEEIIDQIQLTNDIDMIKLDDEMINEFDHDSIDMSSSIVIDKDQLAIRIESGNEYIAITPDGEKFKAIKVK